ncbi:MAG: hypothetical protein M1826_004108 [Phylliscum demangeonii]|nr:MAG: hypothetical protein M1826_004108 [Phylliscum demangeonii]
MSLGAGVRSGVETYRRLRWTTLLLVRSRASPARCLAGRAYTASSSPPYAVGADPPKTKLVYHLLGSDFFGTGIILRPSLGLTNFIRCQTAIELCLVLYVWGQVILYLLLLDRDHAIVRLKRSIHLTFNSPRNTIVLGALVLVYALGVALIGAGIIWQLGLGLTTLTSFLCVAGGFSTLAVFAFLYPIAEISATDHRSSSTFSLSSEPTPFRTLRDMLVLGVWVLLVYAPLATFIDAGVVLLLGLGLTTFTTCKAATELCLTFSAGGKVLLYLFLVERGHAIRAARLVRYKD